MEKIKRYMCFQCVFKFQDFQEVQELILGAQLGEIWAEAILVILSPLKATGAQHEGYLDASWDIFGPTWADFQPN